MSKGAVIRGTKTLLRMKGGDKWVVINTKGGIIGNIVIEQHKEQQAKENQGMQDQQQGKEGKSAVKRQQRSKYVMEKEQRRCSKARSSK